MYLIDEGTIRNKTGRASIVESLKYDNNITEGVVVSVYDPKYLGRIKVRIKGSPNKGGDDNVTDENLPWSFPLLPKLIGIQPKPKEAVLIFLMDENKPFTDRLYLGPINSQPHLLNLDPYYYSAWAGFSFGSQDAAVSIDTIPAVKGVFPNPQDVSIQGRYNTDITQKENEVVIRAGKFETNKPSKTNPFTFKFNTKTQGYIQIKNNAILVKDSTETTNDETERGSVTNIVSNKINLLTHKNGSPRFNLTNQDNLISDEELLKIIDDAHQLPFGDVLLTYLRLMKDAIFAHVHNGNGNPATDLTGSGNKQAIAIFKKKADDLEKAMLSRNVRIN